MCSHSSPLKTEALTDLIHFLILSGREIFYWELKSVLVLLISNVWTQFLKFWCCLVKTIPRTPHGWMLLLDFAKATMDGDTCRTPCAGWGSAPHMSPWPCWWPRDTNSSSQEMPGSPHYCTSQAGLTNTGEYAGTPVRIFPPISSILTKAGGKRSLSNGFFFCFILLPPSLPPVIWFFTPHLCVFIQLIFVFSFFFHTFGSALSPCLAPVIISFSFTMQTCRAAFNNREDLTDWSFDNGGGKGTIAAFSAVYFVQKAFDSVTIW